MFTFVFFTKKLYSWQIYRFKRIFVWVYIYRLMFNVLPFYRPDCKDNLLI